MKLKQSDIHIISRNSNWPEEDVKDSLQKHVYNDAKAWQNFLKLASLSLGVAFTVAGIIFFFAYNWNDIPKFGKLTIVEILMIGVVLPIFFIKTNQLLKDVLLTGAAVLVGVCFATFGQIYQTGANAYDFFFGWTVFVTLWVFAANFPPLWLIYLMLINTALTLYKEQMNPGWSDHVFLSILFVVNASSLIGFITASKFLPKLKTPNWFLNVLAIASVFLGTVVAIGIIDRPIEAKHVTSLVLIAVAYTGGIWYGYQFKKGIYLAIIPFSLITCFCYFLIELSHDAPMLLFISLFVIGSVTAVIKNLLHLQKKWKNG